MPALLNSLGKTMNQLKNKILKLDASTLKKDSIDADLLHVESAAKNTLRVCGDIAKFYKNGKIELILDKCEDIEEFGQKILKFCKRIEVEAKKQVK